MAINIKNLNDCVGLLKRRKYLIVIPWVLLSGIAVLVAYNLPKTFRSTATMLFEAPLPTNLFESTASQFAEEQIQSIYQRVTATENALSLIESFHLYEKLKGKLTDYELATKFREAIEIKLATSTLTPKASSGMAEVAFDLSFSSDDPVKAQELARKLSSLFVEQNDNVRTLRASKATDFLLEESEKLNHDLEDIDNKIAVFKEQNNFSLPDQAEATIAAIDRTENELRDAESQIRTTKERIAFLSSELARAQEETFVQSDNKVPQTRDEAIRNLRAEYLKLLSIYSPSHPSLIRLKREIKSIDPTFEGQPAGEDIQRQLADAKFELKFLEETYFENHPDVIKKKLEIEGLEKRLKNSPLETKENSPVARTVNPAYIGVQAQFKASQSELEALVQKQDFLKTKLDKMHNVMTMAPQVEKAYNDLLRERDNTVKKYTQLKEKLLDAKLLQTQEEQQRGQTLTIIEKPIVPRYPEKAIRRNVAIGGFFVGLFVGFGLALLAEFIDPRVRGARVVSEVTGLMPLIVIPYIENPTEEEKKNTRQQKEKKIVFWVSLSILITIVGLVVYFSVGAETKS